LLQRSLHTISMAQTYSDQKDSLERRFQRTGEDIFVATCSVVEFDRTLVSWCTWLEGIQSLLPQTDYIAFSRPVGDGFDTKLVAWDDAAEIAGKYLETTSEDPPRFFVDRFPSAQEWPAICAIERPRESGER
jgi:hypothetical protein